MCSGPVGLGAKRTRTFDSIKYNFDRQRYIKCPLASKGPFFVTLVSKLRFVLNDYQHILEKLNGFNRKFYTRLLIKGSFLFLVLGILFSLIILGVEYFLWLNSGWRLVLLLAFILVELFLFYKYIVVSIFYLFRFRRGIDNKQASVIIGKHFSEVGDKLLNLLDLAEDENQSELLFASIEQRSQNLALVPFEQAIDFR